METTEMRKARIEKLKAIEREKRFAHITSNSEYWQRRKAGLAGQSITPFKETEDESNN